MKKDSKTVSRKLNFGAGPAMLPEEVLMQVSEAVRDYAGTGMSILELPHRGKYFRDILDEAASLVRSLCAIDSSYHVLWIPGGRLQFAMIPQNFMLPDVPAGYIDSGHWSAQAISYAQLYGMTEVLASSQEKQYHQLPILPDTHHKNLSYLHFTTNNTVEGTQWKEDPRTSVPLIADMSSDIFSCTRDFSRYSFFYAVAQKNIGAAGITLAVVHDDLLKRTIQKLPPILSYQAYVQHKSVVNTPPVFAIYTALLMLRWTSRQTLKQIDLQNEEKAKMLYAEIERNTLFYTQVEDEASRSRMNICFRGINPQVEHNFPTFCAAYDITGISGHRSVGGFRVSLYNAIPIQAVKTLIEAMKDFETEFLNKKS